MHIYLSILYTHIHTYINVCFINTVLQSGVCQNLSSASQFKQIVIKFQSCTDGWLPTSLFLQCKTMLLLYTCCKQTVQSVESSKQASLTPAALCCWEPTYILGNTEARRWGQKVQLKHIKHYKKRDYSV